MVGVQAQDKPDARSAMENDAAEGACLLSHVSIFFLSGEAQLLDEPDTWTLVTVGAAPSLRRRATSRWSCWWVHSVGCGTMEASVATTKGARRTDCVGFVSC